MTTVYEAFTNVLNGTKRALGIFGDAENTRLAELIVKGYKEHEARIIVKLEFKYPVTLDELRIFDELVHDECQK